MANEDVILRREGALGRITLNRPKSLNALTHEMCAQMLQALEAWAKDASVRAVLIDAVPGRAFCAGGDIRSIYDAGRRRDGTAQAFFSTEYRLNAAIKHFPKPYVALIDGIAMGGGAGVSVHGSYRVISEKALFAMPETAIGLYPDVGGTYFLPRCPGEIGMYLALTGERLGPPDMIYSGIATHFVPSAKLGSMSSRLVKGDDVNAALADFAQQAPTPILTEHRDAIDRVFSRDSVENIFSALENEGEWGHETAGLLATRSPTSLKLTFRAMREGQALDFDSCMRMEYRLTNRILEGHDLYEGVRVTLFDKGDTPRWIPATLPEVSDEQIARYFAPLGRDELPL